MRELLVEPLIFANKNLMMQIFFFWFHPSVHCESFWTKHIREKLQRKEKIRKTKDEVDGLHNASFSKDVQETFLQQSTCVSTAQSH